MKAAPSQPLTAEAKERHPSWRRRVGADAPRTTRSSRGDLTPELPSPVPEALTCPQDRDWNWPGVRDIEPQSPVRLLRSRSRHGIFATKRNPGYLRGEPDSSRTSNLLSESKLVILLKVGIRLNSSRIPSLFLADADLINQSRAINIPYISRSEILTQNPTRTTV